MMPPRRRKTRCTVASCDLVSTVAEIRAKTILRLGGSVANLLDVVVQQREAVGELLASEEKDAARPGGCPPSLGSFPSHG